MRFHYRLRVFRRFRRIAKSDYYNDFKYSNNRSTFAEHVINEGHAFGTIDEIMNIIQYERKGKMLDTLEKFYIYRETKNGNQINDRLTVHSNPIFETIVKHSPQGGQHI